MSFDPDLHARLLAAFDPEDALALLRGAIGRQSVTGNEANFVAYLRHEMMTRKILSIGYADFLPGRPNIWGERIGAGDGPRLLFLGHTDTVHVEGWSEHWAGTEREDPFGAPVIEGAVWGRGAGDLKAGICTSLAALSLIDRAGIKLKGDLAFAFIGDEESGQPGTGVSAGIKDYVGRIQAQTIAKPDFAVYVEPTQLSVYSAQIGFFITEITLTGKSAYFGLPELGRDALKASHQVMSALWAHSDDLGTRAQHPLLGKAFLLITGLSGGGFIAVPEGCKLSLIRKLLPGESLDAAAAELEDVVRGAIVDPEIGVEFAYPAGRDHPLGGSPCEVDAGIAPIEQLSAIVGGTLAGHGAIAGAPYWSESPFLAEQLGVPTVYCAPGDIGNCHTFQEHVRLDQYHAGILAFAQFMVRYCGAVDAP